MASRLLLLLAASILIALQLGVNATPQATTGGAAQTQTSTIQGVVTRRDTNVPIPDVRVTVTPGGIGTAQGILVGPAGETINLAPPARGAAGAPVESGARGGATQSFWTAVTDSAGRFSITDVPVGTARVRAQLEGYFGPLTGTDYASFAASDVTLSPGKPTDVSIALIPGATISGRVYDSSGKPLANAAVELLRRGYENGAIRFFTSDFKQTDDRGEYRMFQLPPGEYYVAATPRSTPAALSATARYVTPEIPVQTFYPNDAEPNSMAPLILHDGQELTGMDIRIRTTLTGGISGKVISEAPISPDGHGSYSTVTPGLSIVRRDGVRSSIDNGGRGVEAQPDGSFEIRNLLQGTVSVYDNGFTVGGKQINPVDVHVNTNAGSLEGTVRTSDQKTVRATVVLVPPVARRQNATLYKSVRSDPQGRFQLNAIPPGSYTLFAWESVPNGAWQNAEFLATHAQRGVAVIVNPGTRSMADVTAIEDK